MPTLTDYQNLSQDILLQGIYTDILTTSELAPFLMFEGHSGNAFTYNRESTLPTVSTTTVGQTLADSTMTVTQTSRSLAELYVQMGLDRFALQTKGNINDQRALHLSKMAKAMARKIENLIVNGSTATVSTEPEGILALLIDDSRLLMMDDGSQPSPIAGDETELTMDRLDAMIDLVEGGKPDILMMNKTMRRKLTQLARAVGSGVILTTENMFGHQYTLYNGIPIVINDYISNAETYENSGGWASSTATTIFALKFGEEKEGFTIRHNGPVLQPDVQDIGIREEKNEDLYRMMVYYNTLIYSKLSCAGLAGIDSSA
jgi:HK97 family phage major capsid protein